MIDPTTNRTRIRRVDLGSYSYSVARAYMIRLEKADFDSPTALAALAAEAKMTPQQFRERYEPVVARNDRGTSEPPTSGPASGGLSQVRNGVPAAAR